MTEEKLIFTRKASGLVKGLSWFDIFVLVISAPAGSGILYYSVSTASSYPGGNVGISFLIGMFLILPIILLSAISANMIPRSGSLYVFMSRVINPGIGYFTACLFFLGYTLCIGVVAFVIIQVMGGILVNAGIAGENTTMQQFGELLQNPSWAAVGGAILVFATWFIVLRGITFFQKTMRILFIVTVISVIITVLYFLVSMTANVPQLFNRVWGPDAYENILQAAKNSGWAPALFSFPSTLNLLLVVLFSYGGLELVSYAGGEISYIKKKVIRHYMMSAIFLAAIYIVLAFSVSACFGDFIGAYDYLFKNHPNELKKFMPAISPSIPFYVSSIVPNIWVGIVISLTLSLWLVTTMIPYFFAPSRLIFALAMDHAIPESLADVNEKTGAPTKASHLTLIFALLGVVFNLLNVSSVLGTILFCAIFVYWLYGLSAILLPYKNPELYESCPIKKTVFSIPVISLLGALVFSIGWFVIFIAVRQMSIDVGIALCVYLLIVLILYCYKLNKNKSQGIDINSIYAQLPPD